MKYTIEGFDQELLVKWGLDSNDAIILRWFVDFYHSNKMAKVDLDGEMYLWVNYQACIDDLPIMKITNKQVIARHFKKFITCGLMKPHLSFNGGTYTCFKLVESEYVKLIEKQTQSQGVDLKVEGGQLKSQGGVDSKVEPKDSSINNPSIKSLDVSLINNGKLTHDKYKEKVKLWFIENKKRLQDEYFDLWKETYQNINIPITVNKAYTWLLSNPDNQKKQFLKFINNWLQNAQQHYEEKHNK